MAPEDISTTIGPRQVALITTRANIQKPLSASTEEKDNVTAVEWHMLCSPDPQHYKSSLGTLFLSYIAEVLARVLPRFATPLRSVR